MLSLQRESMIIKPFEYLIGTPVGGKYWVEYMLNSVVSKHQCQPLQEPHAINHKGR